MNHHNFTLDAAELNSSNSPQLFEKRTVVELSDQDLMEVQGGTSPYAASVAIVWATIQIGQAGYNFGQWLR